MAFGDFQYPEVLTRFGLRWNSVIDMFAGVPPVEPSENFRATYQGSVNLGTSAHSEFSRAVWVVGPLLAEFWNRYHGAITLLAGGDLRVQTPPELRGVCDFIICAYPHNHVALPPVRAVGFMAPGGNWENALGGCIAALVAAQRLNGSDERPVFGFITIGSYWQFLRLRGSELDFELGGYGYSEADRILGILTYIVGPPLAQVAA